MLATIFFLGLLYVLFVVALVALQVSLAMVLLVAAGLLFAQYYFADRIALMGMGRVR